MLTVLSVEKPSITNILFVILVLLIYYSQDYIYTKNINFPQSFSTEAVGIGKLRLSTYTPNVHNTPDSEVVNREIRIQEIPEMVTLNGTSLFDIRPRGF